MRSSLSLVIAAVNLLLLGGIGAAWLSGRTTWTPPPALTPAAALFAPPAVAPTTVVGEVGLHERPLFAADRRPSAAGGDQAGAEAQADAAPPQDAFDQAVLVGLAGGGGQGVALVALQEEVHRVAVGEGLDGWTLEAIVGLVAHFSNAAGERRELPIKPPERELSSPDEGQPEANAAGGGVAASDATAADSRVRQQIAERRQRREALLREHRARQRRMQQNKAPGG